MKIALNTKGGFTLIEVLLAIGVATIAFIPLLGMIPLALNTSKVSSDETHAIHLIGAVIQDLRYTPATETQSKVFQISPLPNQNPQVNSPFKVWIDSSWKTHPKGSRPQGQSYELEWKYLSIRDGTKITPVTAQITVRWPPKTNSSGSANDNKQGGGELTTEVSFLMP